MNETTYYKLGDVVAQAVEASVDWHGVLEKCDVCSEVSVHWFVHYPTPTQRRCLALPARPDGTMPAVAMPDVIKLHCPVGRLYD